MLESDGEISTFNPRPRRSNWIRLGAWKPLKITDGRVSRHPQVRAEVMYFTEPWTRLEVCLSGPHATNLGAFDATAARIACLDGGAYTLWLERHMSSATLIRCGWFAHSVSAAIDGRADVVIGIRPFFDDLELVVGGDRTTDNCRSSPTVSRILVRVGGGIELLMGWSDESRMLSKTACF